MREDPLGLSIRLRNGVANMFGIPPRDVTTAHLRAVDQRALMRMPNFGKQTLRELHSIIGQDSDPSNGRRSVAILLSPADCTAISTDIITTGTAYIAMRADGTAVRLDPDMVHA